MDRLNEILAEERRTPKGVSPRVPRRSPLLHFIFPHNRRDRHMENDAWFSGAWFSGAWISGAVEGAILCLVALALSAWASPDDPFGVHGQFPWLWTVPAIVAMRYGTSTGVWTAIVLLSAWFVLHGLPPHIGLGPSFYSDTFPQSYFVGGTVWVLVCGQFSDVWSGRHRRIISANAYFNERLQTVTRNHFLLRLSHERLEQDMLFKPMTLRETLVRLRDATGMGWRRGEPMPGAADFLQIVGQSCQLEIAGVYPMANNEPDPLPAASLGAAGELDLNDALVRACLDQHKLTHVRNLEEARQTSRYLVCGPLRAASGGLLGVLVVEKMPFSTLNNDILQLMTVLCGYYADGLEQEHAVSAIQKQVPNCPHDFALDLTRLCRIHHEAGIDSSMVALVFDHNNDSLDLFENVKRLKRSIDQSWVFSNDRHYVMITLLPLSGAQAIDGYLLRIEHALQTLFGKDFLAAHVATHVGHLCATPPAEMLAQLVERCDA